jgi:hypothetical protein
LNGSLGEIVSTARGSSGVTNPRGGTLRTHYRPVLPALYRRRADPEFIARTGD